MISSTRRRKQGGKEAPPEEEPVPAVVSEARTRHLSPGQCRSFTRKEVAKEMPTIVGSFVEHAKQGSVPHLNLLTKIGGFDQRPVAAAAKRPGRSATRRLLDDLRAQQARAIARHEARLAAGQPTGDSAQ